jgi:hypothetical protein
MTRYCRLVVYSKVQQRYEMRVGHRGQHPRLSLEARAQVGPTPVRGKEQFDRHRALEFQVLGAVDDTHTPAPSGATMR